MPPPIAEAPPADLHRQPVQRLAPLRGGWLRVTLYAVASAMALVASFMAGRIAERRLGDPTRLDQIDLGSRTLEFSVPVGPGEAEVLDGERQAEQAEPRRLGLKIRLPLPVRITPPFMRKRTKRDAQLMAGQLSLDTEHIRTRYLRWFRFIGCYALSATDTPHTDEAHITFQDFRCMKAEGATPESPCASGLPFYRRVLQDRQSNADCMVFCLSKGLDQYGIVPLTPRQMLTQHFTDDRMECRCGASERNEAVWGETPDRAKMIYFPGRLKERDARCRLFAWQYTGPMPAKAVPFQFYQMSVSDMGYIDSIVKGKSCMGREEDTGRAPSAGRPVETVLAHSGRSEEPPGRRLGLCRDEAWTGLAMNGKPASCRQLRHLCQDPHHGQHVRNVCKETCGICRGGGFPPCFPYTCASGRPWPEKTSEGHVHIPYYFCSNVNRVTREVFRNAAREYMLMTCIRFSEQPDARSARLKVCVRNVTSCDATIGFPGDNEEADLNPGWCRSPIHYGSILHELGHVIGMDHEQRRPDGPEELLTPDGPRGPHLEVLWQNIAPGLRAQFLPKEQSYVGSSSQGGAPDGGVDTHAGYAEYDYASVMHYSPDISTDRLRPAFITRHPVEETMVGDRSRLSDGDLRQIADMYQCQMSYDPWYQAPMPTPSWSPPAPRPPPLSPPSPPSPPPPPSLQTRPWYDVFGFWRWLSSLFHQGVSPRPPDRVKPSNASGSCKDVDPPGWTCEGRTCTCYQLAGHCHNTIYSLDVQRSCPETCGTCDDAVFECRNLPPEGWTCNGGACSCDLLAGYCHDAAHGAAVASSCRATCGQC